MLYLSASCLLPATGEIQCAFAHSLKTQPIVKTSGTHYIWYIWYYVFGLDFKRLTDICSRCTLYSYYIVSLLGRVWQMTAFLIVIVIVKAPPAG